VIGNGDVHKWLETVHDSTKRIGTVFEPDKLGDSINASAWQQWSPRQRNLAAGSCRCAGDIARTALSMAGPTSRRCRAQLEMECRRVHFQPDQGPWRDDCGQMARWGGHLG
jgi:hypothetical protein